MAHRDRNTRREQQKCRRAIKILEQYERLAEKQAAKISPRQLKDLNHLRNSGKITIRHLPGSLHSKFPTEYQEMTLNEIRECLKRL